MTDDKPAAAAVEDPRDAIPEEEENFDGEMEDGYFPCPICNAPNCPGAYDVCEHYVCTLGGWEAEYDFIEQAETVYDLLQDMSDEQEVKVFQAPEPLLSLLKEARESRDFWANDEDVDEVDWDVSNSSGGPCELGGEGSYLYHKNPGEFETRVSEKIQQALAWLKQHRVGEDGEE